jgi:adenosylmethionine-8-amino-7-oxononanoate aminotransferase
MLQRHAAGRGVFLRPLGSVVYLLPPLCLSDAQLDQCYAVIREGLDLL